MMKQQVKPTGKDIKRVAALASLSLSEGEAEALTEDILDMLSVAQSLLTDTLQTDLPDGETQGVMRKDARGKAWPCDVWLSCAPSADSPYITVPRVVGGPEHDE